MSTHPQENGVPARYAEALDGTEPLDVLEKTPRRLARAVREARRKDLETRPAPGAWSVRDVLAHLADHEFVAGTRLRMVASHDRPALAAYDEQLFAARLGAERASAKALLKAFAGARAANLELCARLPADAWSRSGVHAERGEVTLLALLVTHAGHDRVHEAQVARTLAAVRDARKAAKAARKAQRKAAKAGKQGAEKAQRGAEERAAAEGNEAREPKRRARGKVRAGKE